VRSERPSVRQYAFRSTRRQDRAAPRRRVGDTIKSKLSERVEATTTLTNTARKPSKNAIYLPAQAPQNAKTSVTSYAYPKNLVSYHLQSRTRGRLVWFNVIALGPLVP
jgi:hypothetical protein